MKHLLMLNVLPRQHLQTVVACCAGTLFGAGLAFSGMIDPQRVRGFLDLFGAWDPTLAFVMGGALVPMAIAWQLQRRMKQPLLSTNFALPTRRDFDWQLMTGAVLFGLGWGITGLCPGPAIAGIAISPLPASIFVLAMLSGMLLHRVIVAPKRISEATNAPPQTHGSSS